MKIRKITTFLKNLDEVSVLYISKLIRSLAMNLSKGFVFMYIYNLGYGWRGVILAMIFNWVMRFVGVILGGRYAAKRGPKHGILASNLMSIPSLFLIGVAHEWGVLALALAMIFEGISTSFYSISYYIDFSKARKGANSARQISVMQVIEKITAIFAPILGAWISVGVGAHLTMFVSAGIFAISALPLLVTREIMDLNIPLDIKTFPAKNHLKNFISHFWVGAFGAYVGLWSIFVAVFLFSNDNNYGVIGVLASMSSIISILASMWCGKFLTKNNGQWILGGSVVARGVLMIVTGLAVWSKSAAILVNVLKEVGTEFYRASNTRGAFSDADSSGRRIEYFMIFESCYTLGVLAFSCLAGILLGIFEAEIALRSFFVVAGVVIFLALGFRYPAFSGRNGMVK